MKYSKEQLNDIAQNTGFRAEIIEKVLLLMDLLSVFASDHILQQSMVLKGGTALNLFYLDLPRLSVDIDLNYIGETNRENIPILDIHELTAGKLSALIDRKLGRDFFDVYNLLIHKDLDMEILRLVFTVYAGIGRKKSFRLFSPEQLDFDFKELQNRLFPLLSKRELDKIADKVQWAKKMLTEIHIKLGEFFPLRENEVGFLEALLNFGEIKPELLTDKIDFQEKVKAHPAILWAACNVKRQ